MTDAPGLQQHLAAGVIFGWRFSDTTASWTNRVRPRSRRSGNRCGKRATAYLLRDVERVGEKMSVVGGHVVVVDGDDRPRAVWRTRTVEVKPLDQVDDAFAWDEGEGGRTRADWLDMHVRYVQAQAKSQGFIFDEAMVAVFERFTLVWPPGDADAEGT
jgi:uncharacterized protein YhfF